MGVADVVIAALFCVGCVLFVIDGAMYISECNALPDTPEARGTCERVPQRSASQQPLARRPAEHRCSVIAPLMRVSIFAVPAGGTHSKLYTGGSVIFTVACVIWTWVAAKDLQSQGEAATTGA